jgi:hypothetical protein
MRRLDSAQLAAATGRASIQLTLAGPGSGKTSTLTGRFVHLIRQGVDPARILAVTFTKKAADEMRRRIVRLLELPSPSSLHVMTFHAFAFRQLKRNPGMAGLPERFQFWDAAEQRQVFSSRRMWWNDRDGHQHPDGPLCLSHPAGRRPGTHPNVRSSAMFAPAGMASGRRCRARALKGQGGPTQLARNVQFHYSLS